MTPEERIKSVVIGGSAGALDALVRLLGSLPADFASPLVIVVHLARHQPSSLPEALRASCRLPVREPRDKEPLAPGIVYVAPPSYHLLIDRGPSFAFSVDEPVNYSQPSIDVLFESAADVLGPAVVGVLLSDANPDGAAGLRLIQEAGGLAIVQAPGDSAHRAMPDAAIHACPGALVLSAKAIGEHLAHLSSLALRAPRGRP
jgi:two-component system chemotaxis response regulator CheB